MKTANNFFLRLVVLSLLVFPDVVRAQFYYTNADGSVLVYETNSGTIAITGYTGSSGSLVLPESIAGLPVTVIGTNTFDSATNLMNVVLPDTIFDIQDSAFQNSGLINFIIPDSVTHVGNFAFQGCTSLSNILIGNGVTNIDSFAFAGCTSLTNVTMPSSVVAIGNDIFSQCANLKEIKLSTNLVNISIGDFGNCISLSDMIIPDSITNIGNVAFIRCTNLSSILIPNSVSGIGIDAFRNCYSLTNITVGRGILSIGSSAFNNCPNLASAYFLGNAPAPVGYNPFSGDPVIIYYYDGAEGWPWLHLEDYGIQQIDLGPGLIPPSITSQPQDNTVTNPNEPVMFQVVIQGSLPLAYHWSLNGTNILGATSAGLSIPFVTPSSLGTYSVVVSNAYGVVTSSNANLMMFPYLKMPFMGLSTPWGFTNTLSVTAWGTGPLSFQWYFDGNAIQDATNQTFVLSDTVFTNAGLYSVVVSSPLGSVTNTPEQVAVNPAGTSLGLYPGVTITGLVGQNYIIQSSTNLADPSAWATVTNFTLTTSIQLWVDPNVDTSLPENPYRYYRVLLGQ